MKDYILKVQVAYFSNDCGFNLVGTLHKWVRFPECPQPGWFVMDSRRAASVTVQDGVFGVLVEASPFVLQTKEAAGELFELMQSRDGFATLDKFNLSGPPR